MGLAGVSAMGLRVLLRVGDLSSAVAIRLAILLALCDRDSASRCPLTSSSSVMARWSLWCFSRPRPTLALIVTLSHCGLTAVLAAHRPCMARIAALPHAPTCAGRVSAHCFAPICDRRHEVDCPLCRCGRQGPNLCRCLTATARQEHPRGRGGPGPPCCRTRSVSAAQTASALWQRLGAPDRGRRDREPGGRSEHAGHRP